MPYARLRSSNVNNNLEKKKEKKKNRESISNGRLDEYEPIGIVFVSETKLLD